MSTGRLASLGFMLLSLTACASTGFVSTWRAPDAQPLTGDGPKVAAVVMSKDESVRRAAEDALARELTRRGAEGVAMYTIFAPSDPGNEALAKAALEKAGVSAVVVMRPVGSTQEVYSTPLPHPAPRGWYWGGYYGYGWGAPWGGAVAGEIRTRTIVSIETLVYSMKQNKLVWAGQSETTSPSSVDSLVKEIIAAVASEMKKQRLI